MKGSPSCSFNYSSTYTCKQGSKHADSSLVLCITWCSVCVALGKESVSHAENRIGHARAQQVERASQWLKHKESHTIMCMHAFGMIQF